VRVKEGPAAGSLAAMKKIDLEKCNDYKIDEIRVEVTIAEVLEFLKFFFF
jgi:hypothetical protein